MDDQLRENRSADGVELILPQRSIKALPVIGLVLIGISLIPLLIGYQFIVDPLNDFLNGEGSGRYFSLFFAIVGLIPALTGLAFLLAGICMLFLRSHVRIFITPQELRAREQLGPFFKNWRMPRDKLQSLQVVNATVVRNNNKQEITTRLYGIFAKGSGDTEMRFAPGYDIDLLERVSAIIRDETGVEVLAPNLEFRQEDAQDVVDTVPDTPMPEQLEHSAIECEDRPDGLAIRVPPTGLNKGSKGLFTFAVIWNALTLVIMGGLMWAAIGKGDRDAWTGVFAMLFFLAIGIGIGLGAVNMGRRKADFLLMRSLLTIKRSSIFGEKVLEIDVGDIKKIITGPSGMEVNGKKVYELQVFNTSNDKVVGMLSQLDDNELNWMADLLSWKLRQFQR